MAAGVGGAAEAAGLGGGATAARVAAAPAAAVGGSTAQPSSPEQIPRRSEAAAVAGRTPISGSEASPGHAEAVFKLFDRAGPHKV